MVPERRTAILVLLIGLCLMAAPGAGRAIGNGDTVFDYEADLDLSGIAEDGDQLAMYADDDTTKGQIFSFPVAVAASLDLTQIGMQGNYGTYFVVSGGVPGARIYIRDPTVTFDIVLDNDIGYSIVGRYVTQDTPIAFKFDATEVGTYLPTATVQVRITTPDGSTLTSILDADGNAQDLTGHVVSAPRTYIRDIDISQLGEGGYAAQVTWESPQGFADYASDTCISIFKILGSKRRIIDNGGTIFDYEQNLDLSSILHDYDKLVKYTDDDPAKEPVFSIQVKYAITFDLSHINLQGHYGKYFCESDPTKMVYIKKPAVAFDVVFDDDLESSIDGKSLIKDTRIAFLFGAEEISTCLTGENTATVNVEITSPSGAVLSLIPDESGAIHDLTNHALSEPETAIRDIDISQLEDGRYVAQAVWSYPDGFAYYAPGSAQISFTILETGVIPPAQPTAIPLSPGWNFVSTPKTLAAGSDTALIFAGVDTAGHSILRYDTPTGAWAALKPTDPVRPLEGYWIYAATATEIPLTYATASPQAPATRTLTVGWNAFGFSDTEPATARDTLVSLGSAWSVLMGFDGESQTYETSIIRGGSGDHSDSGWMLPAKGYWLYMTGNGTLAAIGA